MKNAYLHGRSFREDGTVDSLWTEKVPAKDAPMRHHALGLSFTASGYGRKIPARHMVLFNGRWRRVYCCIFSNSGTCYIGKWVTGRGAEINVQEVY